MYIIYRFFIQNKWKKEFYEYSFEKEKNNENCLIILNALFFFLGR